MRLFEQVDAAQKGAFARAAGADDADDIAGLGGQGHALDHFVTAIALVQILHFQFVHALGFHSTVNH